MLNSKNKPKSQKYKLLSNILVTYQTIVLESWMDKSTTFSSLEASSLSPSTIKQEKNNVN